MSTSRTPRRAEGSRGLLQAFLAVAGHVFLRVLPAEHGGRGWRERARDSAQRVRMLVTDAVVNESTDPALLCRRYERRIAELKQELAMRDAFSGRGKVSYDDLDDALRTMAILSLIHI